MDDPHDLLNLTGRPWSEARLELQARGFGDEALRVLDITPERAPRTPTQPFGWGQERVVRARVEGLGIVVTIAREIKILA